MIDNLRGYPAELVEELRGRLGQSGLPRSQPSRKVESRQVVVRADPRRDGFYEIEADDRIFYIPVSPVTGKVFLLATWPRRVAPELPHEEFLAERVAP